MLIFRPKRLPEIGRSLGTGIRELKDSLAGHGEDTTTSSSSTAEVTAPRQAPDA
jgi:Sec-independent protein translocase protein TatA